MHITMLKEMTIIYRVRIVPIPNFSLAGKSTFYNAATCAALRGGDGRKMAEVAPHPFTTIEPNIGPGWFAGPQDNKYDQGRVTAYGRDSTDRRLLPVLIKDVAGLVPGAYKGRGKGIKMSTSTTTKFTNKICNFGIFNIYYFLYKGITILFFEVF